MFFDLYLVLAQLYATTILIRQSQAYVLLAANIDDFKSIARKFVPDHLVNQLADLAAKPPVINAGNEYPQFKNKPTSDMEQEESKEVISMRREKEALRLTKVNFEQLVQKVKERLKKDFEEDSHEISPRFKKHYPGEGEYRAPKRIADQHRGDDTGKGFNKNKYGDYDFERSTAQNKYADDEVDERSPPKNKYADYDVEKSRAQNKYADDDTERSHAKNKYADDEADERSPPKNKYADNDAERSHVKNKYTDDDVENSPPKDKYDDDEVEKSSSKNRYQDDNIPKKYANEENIEENNGNPLVRPPRIDAKKPLKVGKPERPTNEKPHTTKDDSEQYKDYAGKDDYKINQDVPEKPKKSKKETLDDSMLFSKVEMLKDDSYGDYVTPPKEDNIFESVEQTSRVPLKKPKEIIKAMKQKAENINKKTSGVVQLKEQTEDAPKSPKGTVQKLTAKDEDKEIVDVVIGDEEAAEDKEYKEYPNGEDLKAKTENINYDEFATTKPEPETEDTTPGSAGTTKKKRQGTMFPKRDYYKISSPNYLAKVPVIAEGYNFDEPIPEKDQEPEDLKRLLPMPPSVINGKVKFSK